MRKKGMPTARQQAILDFVKSYIEEHNYAPTVREIGDAVGLSSTSSVHANLRHLAEAGFLVYQKGVRRAISLPTSEDVENSVTEIPVKQTVPIPIVGNVAAGSPILAVDNIQDYFALPKELLNGAPMENVFMLVIKGTSMINAGIMDGDYIIVNAGPSVNNGDIAVVRVSGDFATVKRFYRERDRARLQPENDTMDPIYVPLSEVDIVGRVIGLVRQY